MTRILVIEDDPDAAEMVRLTLERGGYDCEAETDSAEGARRASAESFDLLIVDLLMPGMNGLKVAEAVRRSGSRVPILMLTGRQDDLILPGAAKHAGVSRLLFKPPDPDRLFAEVRKLTGGT